MTRRIVRFTITALQQVRRLDDWWREHSARPEIFYHDLSEAIDMLSMLPAIGTPYRSSPLSGVRRLYLSRLTSHLYYTYDEREVIIRALWHARLGSGPDLH